MAEVKKMYNIKQISNMTGLSAPTLRYYENEHLLSDVQRDDNGVRIYSEEDLSLIRFVKCLRSTNMPISEIKRYMSLYSHGSETLCERKQIMLTQKRRVEQMIKELEHSLETINFKISLYEMEEEELQQRGLRI